MGPPTLFRSYKVSRNRTYNPTIWQALRATCARPSNFLPISFGYPTEVEYVSGSLGYNNPTQLAIEECRSIEPDIIAVMSVGTGSQSTASLHTDGISGAARRLVEGSEKVVDDVGKILQSVYFRFDVDRVLDTTSFGSSPSRLLNIIQTRTQGCLQRFALSQKLDECIRMLLPRNSESIWGRLNMLRCLLVSKREREVVLNWLSTMRFTGQHEEIFRDISDGSGEWLFNEPEFVEWEAPTDRSVFWLHGIRS